MTANPTCSSDTVEISGFSDPIPKLLYGTVTDVSGCSAYDSKVVQLLYDSVSGNWLSDDADLVIKFSFSPSVKSLEAYCVGDFPGFPPMTFGTFTTPVDESFANEQLPCCGTVDIHVGETP